MPQIVEKTDQTLKQQIAASRDKLQILWNTHGHSSSAVLAASIELDELINRYHSRQKSPAPEVSD